MPVTPFHMGPGMAIKAVLRHRFSLVVFGVSQFLIDLQPGIALAYDHPDVHGWTHTWLGALLVGAGSVILGKYLADLGFRTMERWGRPPTIVSWRVAALSAYIGTFSHVMLDSLTQRDNHPFAPFSDAQPWLYAVTVRELYLGCVVAGILGLVAYGVTELSLARRRQRRP